MTVQSFANQHNTIFTLDEILQNVPETATEGPTDIDENVYKQELNEELKTTDRVWLEFHAGQCEQYGKAAKSLLYRIMKSSVGHPENSIAAANAITILKVMKVSFSCLDLRGVQIPGANLSNAILDSADLADADLENTNLTHVSLNGTNVLKANLKKVSFDIPTLLIHKNKIVSRIIISPDNKYLVSEDYEYMFFWHLPSKVCTKKIARVDKFIDSFSKKTFTPDGQFLFIYGLDISQSKINILSVNNFNFVGEIEISDQIENFIHFAFSIDGIYFIAYKSVIKTPIPQTHLRIWKIQKTVNGCLDICLKNEVVLSYWISNLQFSKKFPVFYCLKIEGNGPCKRVGLSIWNIENFSEVAAVPKVSEEFTLGDLFRLGCMNMQKLDSWFDEFFSLDILNTNNMDEECLFIAVVHSIYNINVIKRNEQNLVLEASQITKIATHIDLIHNMQILEKTYELIYVHKGTISLYNIRNNQLIAKFRLLDTDLNELPISFDKTTIFISCLNKVFMHSLESLKNNKYVSYGMYSDTTCFSSDMRSIISLSDSCYMYVYDVETGNILASKFLKKMKPYISNRLKYKISFSPNTQHILINASNYFRSADPSTLSIINAENNETFLESTENNNIFVLSSNSEYLVFVDSEKKFVIYKTIPSKLCIWKSDLLQVQKSSHIAISVNFCIAPKIALIDISNKVIVCTFAFNDKTLNLVSRKERSVGKGEVLQLIFTENDSKLIIASTEKIIIWDIERDLHEACDIQASYVDISYDGSLLIYYDRDEDKLNASNHQLCLWSISQKKPLIVQSLSIAVTRIQISPDNRYIIGTVENGGIYVWKILENTFRLLWRTSHNLQTQGLILGDNNLDEGIEEDLVTKMGAVKIANA